MPTAAGDGGEGGSPEPGRSQSRTGRIADDPVANATRLPSGSITSAEATARLRPLWTTRPVAMRTLPSPATGRRKFTLTSTGAVVIPCGVADVAAAARA